MARRTKRGAGLTLSLEASFAEWQAGDSVAVNGACLTLKQSGHGVFAVDLSPETLNKTTLGGLTVGARVHLERALRASDRLGGHFVTGHVDGVGRLVERDQQGEWTSLAFEVPQALTKHLACKGSVAVDGVSLTINDVQAARFGVAIIPYTLEHTRFGALQVGDLVNIETDLLAKYVERLTAAHSVS